MGFESINGHDLYRKVGPGPEERCPRIGFRESLEAEMRRAHAPEADIAEYLERVGHHDETCRTCHGTGLHRPQITVAYWCRGCGQEGALEDFGTTSCLGLGAGLYEELREQLDGDHDSFKPTTIPGCPLCAAERLKAAALAATP